MLRAAMAHLRTTFLVPLIVILGIAAYLALAFLGLQMAAVAAILSVTAVGSYALFRDTAVSLGKRRFALDYVAVLALLVALITQEYVVAAVLALMVSSGKTLEEYGTAQAKKSLTALARRIPQEVTVWEKSRPGPKKKIGGISTGTEILVRRGEVIALDGVLVSRKGLTDESSLTGEPYLIEKIRGDQLRSGTVNIGDPIIIRVTKKEADSAYKKIMEMVRKAQEEKSPLVRLADKYSVVFTLITFAIAGFAFVYSGYDLKRVLSVLAIATPCPLIIAAPVALLGGVNASAKKRIIVKKLSSLETLSRANAIIFDKTGTITLGKPRISALEITGKKYSEKGALAIAEAIERNSLHPLAKAVVEYAREKKARVLHAYNVKEQIGSGISGTVNRKRYSLRKLKDAGMAVALLEGKKQVAVIRFEDEIKQESGDIIRYLKGKGHEIFIFTGDKKEAADSVAARLGENIIVRAGCTPEDKQKGIKELQKQGKITAMVGDGINDAPALALADVGLVFSNEEQTAASEAADIVFLGGDFSHVAVSYEIAKRTVSIALQSMRWGIGLSIAGMAFASLGFIPPIFGAGLQEAIDVAVIINALRASR